ncbi:MAG: AI-2E family transporter [Butyrivibrio sp.]|nr:AI-2E family transporter [Butyrivibrio sp.]
MKYKLGKKEISAIIGVFALVVASLLAYYVIFKGNTIIVGIKSVLSSLKGIIWGVIFAYLILPVLNWIERQFLVPFYKKKGKDIYGENGLKHRKSIRKISVLISMIILILIIYGLISIIVPQLIKSIQEIVTNFPAYMDNINNLTEEYLASNPQMSSSVNTVIDSVQEYVTGFVDKTVIPNISVIMKYVSKSAVLIVQTFFNIIVGLIVAVYILNSKEVFSGQGKKMAYAFFEEKYANEVVGAFRFIHSTFTNFFVGKIIDSIIIGFICYFGSLILGIPFPLLVSVIVGITNIIPFFGPYIGAIFGAALLVLINPIKSLVFLIFVVALQQFDGNILGPKILGSSTGLSSFWVIFSIMFFGSVMGPIGWLLGVPIFACIYAFIARITNVRLEKKHIGGSTIDYMDVAYIEDGEKKFISDPVNTKFNTGKQESSIKKAFNVKDREKDKSQDDEKY